MKILTGSCLKELIAVLFISAFFVLLTGCSNVSASENTNRVIKWFDCFDGDNVSTEHPVEYSLEEFPGVTFRCDSEKMEAVTESGAVTLYTGWPVASTFFYDLNGDGKPELCSSVCWGFGAVDERLAVYDYTAGELYELSGRFDFDYKFNSDGDSLIIEKRRYNQPEIIESGEAELADGIIRIKCQETA